MSRAHMLPAPAVARTTWMLFGVAVLHAWLLHAVDDPLSSRALLLRLLQPTVTICAAIMLILTAWHHGPGRPQRAWLLIAAGMMVGAIGVLLDLQLQVSLIVPSGVSTALFLLAYLFGIIGVALYFPYRSLWTGDTRRLILDSIAVGYAMLIIGQNLLTQQFDNRTWFSTVGDVGYIAFNTGVLFALLVLYARYGNSGGPLLVLAALSVVCVVIADLLAALFPLMGWDVRWRDSATAPLFSLQALLLSLGAYRSLKHPPHLRDERPEPMPLVETVVWTLPRGLLLIALVITSLFPTPPIFLAILLALVLLHEAIALYDQQRVWRVLYAMTNRERQARELVRFFQHELKGYTTGLEGLAPILRQRLARDGHVIGEEGGRLLDALDRNVGQLTTLLQVLLILTRDGALPTEQRTRISMARLVAEIQSDLSAALVQGDNQLKLHINVPEDLMVHVHPLYVSLAIGTALRNALEAVGASKRPQMVTLSAFARGERVVIRIEDDGLGFPPDVLARLKLLSQQGLLLSSGLTNKKEGYGLGLPLIARVAYLHSGTFGFGNLLQGTGAWIEFDLPRAHVRDSPPFHRA